MKTIIIIASLAIMLCACSEKPAEVVSIDQIPGLWIWESTCEGEEYDCVFSSKSETATIEFTAEGKYIEIHNDIIFLESDYTIEKYDDMYGTLILENPYTSRPITIINNRLLINRGESLDTYYKVK